MQSIPLRTVRVQASRGFDLAIAVVHVLAATGVLLSALHPWAKALALTALGASLALGRRRVDCEALVLHGDGRLQIVGAGGAATARELDSGTANRGPLIVLALRGPEKPRRLLLLAGSFPNRDDYRLVRRWVATSKFDAASAVRG